MASKSPSSRVLIGIVMGVALGVVLHEATKTQDSLSIKGELKPPYMGCVPGTDTCSDGRTCCLLQCLTQQECQERTAQSAGGCYGSIGANCNPISGGLPCCSGLMCQDGACVEQTASIIGAQCAPAGVVCTSGVSGYQGLACCPGLICSADICVTVTATLIGTPVVVTVSSAPAYAAYCCGQGPGNGGCMQIFDPSQQSTYCDLNKHGLIPYTVAGFATCQADCNNSTSLPPPPTSNSSAPSGGWCCTKPSNTCVVIPPTSAPSAGCSVNGLGCIGSDMCCSGNCSSGICKGPGL